MLSSRKWAAGGAAAVVPALPEPFWLALQTMREDERAARAMGVDTNKLALKAMVVAGGVAGLAGALYAGGGNHAYQIMTPEISFAKWSRHGSLDV